VGLPGQEPPNADSVLSHLATYRLNEPGKQSLSLTPKAFGDTTDWDTSKKGCRLSIPLLHPCSPHAARRAVAHPGAEAGRPQLLSVDVILCGPLSHPRYPRHPRFKTSVAAEPLRNAIFRNHHVPRRFCTASLFFSSAGKEGGSSPRRGAPELKPGAGGAPGMATEQKRSP